MNTHELNTFLILTDKLHFGQASRACNLSPSALTRSIQRLEEELDQRLFTRDNRNVALTPAGELFKTYALRAQADWKALMNDLHDAPLISGTLSIYASITAVYSLLPSLLEAYRTAHPHVQIELNSGAAEQSVNQVLAGEIDLAVAALPDRPAGHIEFLPLTEIPLVFIAPISGEFATPPLKGKQLDLMQAPLVLPRNGLSRARLDQWMKDHAILPDIRSEVSGNEALIAMVRLGCGIGVVPQLVLERSPFRDEVQVIGNAPKLAPYTVGLCATKRSLHRPAVQAFWQQADRLPPKRTENATSQ
ncbi:HTH-type transcriptional activator IlvY [Tichowtungia aerotolerans]|uniref:HTH-type transcriptional activator IlvY n=1 Tax=Tichowtungia aerotolerans TaxID=2697043 RepID=A0A6P1MAA3_9BACT|nr:HTH-type transcriptional activator IlvY [Tichowtungia aerotolerans]QHI68055.1 HTH-type transcriptional activator IlvY [Tichowtungia aerotolerans]